MKRMMSRLLTFGMIVGLVFVHTYPVEGTKNDVFKDRRLRLLSTMEGDGIAVFRTQGFNQDFYYLTGIDSGTAALVLLPGELSKSILFLQPQRPSQITWVGKQPTLEEAVALYGVNEVFSVTELESRLGRFLQGRKRIYCDLSD
ncbi:MAG: aminopeptidase P N-terminal domain-containing protein, partial [Candidatus Aminicenantes bacterium]|nr:aminopeptidase P N-terminal domain-containing protein [Candidatus Aminicenantes bacterium]